MTSTRTVIVVLVFSFSDNRRHRRMASCKCFKRYYKSFKGGYNLERFEWVWWRAGGCLSHKSICDDRDRISELKGYIDHAIAMYEANYTTAQVEYVNVRNSLYLWVEQLNKLTFQILHEFVYYAFQKRLHLVPHWRSVQHNEGKSWNSLARYCWWFVLFVLGEFSTMVFRHVSWFRSDLTHRLPVMTDVVLAGNMTAQEYLDSVSSTIGMHKPYITQPHLCTCLLIFS